MYWRTFICLANSRKPPSGRCVAGKVFRGNLAGKWVRPVSARQGREVSEEERRYENGKRSQLLDIIKVPLIEHLPSGHQTENHLLAEDHYWEKDGTASWEQVVALVDPYDAAFWVNADSTFHGLNDKVPEQVAMSLPNSLKLIQLPELQLLVRSEEGFEGRPPRKRVRGQFNYEGRQYLLSVTDPDIEEKYLARDVGVYKIRNVAVCISLAEVWNGFAFRVVASVITPALCKG
jgi:hypothetical protein